MADNPSIITIPEWEWVLVAENVTSLTIDRYNTNVSYYWTYRLTGQTAPDVIIQGELPEEAIKIFDQITPEPFKNTGAVDIYVMCKNNDDDKNDTGKIRVNIGAGESPVTVAGAEDTTRSAFGELSVAEFMPLTGWAFTYNINPGVVNQSIIDTGTIVNNQGHADLDTGSSATGFAKIETVRSSRYIPGVGGLVRFTSIFDTPQEDSKQVIGLINGSDGWAFGYNGTKFGILRKRDNIEEWIYQEDWNVDIKPNFDPTKGNVFQIKYQWLGYGMQYFYMEDENGNLELVHKIKYNNENIETSILNPNLPLSAYVVNIGNTTPIKLRTPSAIAGLNGDGFNDAISTNVAGKSARDITAGDTPFLAFRMQDTYKGKANRLFCQALRLACAADLNKTVTIDAYAGGTVNDGTWNYASEELSPLEVNSDLTSYTTGLFIGSFPLGRLDSQDFPFGETKFRFYAGQQIVLVASTTGAGEVRASVNWKSFV